MKKELSKLKEELIEGVSHKYTDADAFQPFQHDRYATLCPENRLNISLLCWQQSGRSWPSPAAHRDQKSVLMVHTQREQQQREHGSTWAAWLRRSRRQAERKESVWRRANSTAASPHTSPPPPIPIPTPTPLRLPARIERLHGQMLHLTLARLREIQEPLALSSAGVA